MQRIFLRIIFIPLRISACFLTAVTGEFRRKQTVLDYEKTPKSLDFPGFCEL